MKAVILAAGVGVRLRPLTDNHPKCLVEVHGKPMLGHQLASLAAAGIDSCVLVVGYLAAQIRERFGDRSDGVDLSYVENERYAVTNNLYSLWLAREALRDDIILIEGDLVFDSGLLADLVRRDESNIAVVDRFGPGMDGTVILTKGRVADAMVLKANQGPDFHYGPALKTVNIYKLSRSTMCDLIIPELSRYLAEERTDQYYEAVFSDLVGRGRLELSVLEAEPRRWAEVDTPDDLAAAERLFSTPGPPPSETPSPALPGQRRAGRGG
jgi:NDP-sugar pyrophosphorylase family protein